MKRIKRLMGDKMRFENTMMRVIKWESVWNDDRQEKYGRERERERERATNDTYYGYEPSHWG